MERRSDDARIARIETDVAWIRDTLRNENLPNRVRALEDADAERRGAVKALRVAQLLVAIIVSVLTGAMLLRGGS